MSNFLWPPWIVACQSSLSMEFSSQEYWSELPFPPQGDLPEPGTEPASLASPARILLQVVSLSLAPPGKSSLLILWCTIPSYKHPWLIYIFITPPFPRKAIRYFSTLKISTRIPALRHLLWAACTFHLKQSSTPTDFHNFHTHGWSLALGSGIPKLPDSYL